MAKTALSYCAEELRRQDHERYLTCLFAPADRREDLFALYAFNLEVAKIAEVVSEALLGQVRLQWWRESLDGIYAASPRRHGVVAPLAEAIGRHGLARARFDRLIDARETDLRGEAPADMAALEAYAAATSAGLTKLALEILGARGEEVGRAGHHVGVAWALVGLLRAVPFHARRKRLYLPNDLSDAAGLDRGELFTLRSSSALKHVVGEVAATADGHLRAARRLRRQVPRAALPALLPATLASQALASLARAGYDPFDHGVQARPPGRVWRLAWANLRRRY